jgi:peroxiredoxin
MIDTIKNGKFHLEKKFIYKDLKDSESNYEYFVIAEGYSLNIFANPGTKVKITGKGLGNIGLTWRAESNHPLQKELNEYVAYGNKKLATIRKKIQEAREADDIDDELLKKLEKERYNIDINSMLDFMKSREYNDVFASELRRISFLTMMLDDRQLRARVRNLFRDKVPNDYHNDSHIYETKEFLFPSREQLQIGDQMTDFALYDRDGKEHKLSEFKDSGKYVLLEFICRACGDTKLRPSDDMTEIYSKYSDKIQIVSINLDPKDIWEEECKQKKNVEKWPEWNDYNRAEEIIERYGIFGYTLALISPDGFLMDRTGGIGLLEKVKKTIFTK